MDGFQGQCQDGFIVDAEDVQGAGGHDFQQQPEQQAECDAGGAAAEHGFPDARDVLFSQIAADQRLHGFPYAVQNADEQRLHVHDDRIDHNGGHAVKAHEEIVENEYSSPLIDMLEGQAAAHADDMEKILRPRMAGKPKGRIFEKEYGGQRNQG